MEKVAQKFLLMVVLLGVTVLLIPSYGAAFPPIKLGEESEVTFYGFLRNNVGMFLDNPQPFSQNNNDLATARTWFRGYTDFKITNELRFWSAIQFVYEPPYEVEHNSGGSFRTPVDPENLKHGKEYSEYRNINDILRECLIEWKPSKQHTIKIGRQTAIWGEALTTRVGDVVQPDDLRFIPFFANLEDTRIPQWMVRGIHDIESLNSTFEWIANPNLVQNKYSVNRYAHFIAPGEIGQRFSAYPETRFDPPLSVNNTLLGLPFPDPNIVVPHPFSRDWAPFGPGGTYVPLALPTVRVDYPNGWDSFRGGFRTNTTLAGYNFGLSYFHTQNYDPVIKREGLTGRILIPGPPPVGERVYTLVYPNIDIIGFYMNKQLPWPGVIRADVIYVPNKPFNTFKGAGVMPDPITPLSDTVVRRDYIKYMVAYDLTGFLYFSWHKTAPFDITFEHVGEIIPNNNNIQYVNYSTEVKEWNPQFNMRISTNWRYNQISTDLVVGYVPWGNSGLIMPTIKYVPPLLNNQLSFELKYIDVFGKSHFKGLGILQTKDMIVLTTQLNW
jgi:hypothetical protein